MDNLITIKTDNLFFKDPYISTPYNKKLKILMADATATGRASPVVEKYIYDKILPYYANSHSNAFCASFMSKKISEVREYIRNTYNLRRNHIILFSGNGATGAVNHLVHSIDYNLYSNVNIILTVFEHYSDHLPWIKVSKKHKNIKIWSLPVKDDEIDLNALDYFLMNNVNSKTLNIVSITACSNVTGIKTNMEAVKGIIDRYKLNTYLFGDYAGLASHELINGQLLDAIFISGHKFIGGNETPGILIAIHELFTKKHPFIPGGGTVDFANSDKIQYCDDLEEKESGGTPNIVGIIKLKKVMELNYSYLNIIRNNEPIITKYVHNVLNQFMSKYNNLKIIFPNVALNHRLPIICIMIDHISHNDIVLLLNDIFGIQTRGGVSCCGMLAEYLKKHKNIRADGWCRITFSWYMTKKEIDYILKAIEYIIVNGKNIKPNENGYRKALYYEE